MTRSIAHAARLRRAVATPALAAGALALSGCRSGGGIDPLGIILAVAAVLAFFALLAFFFSRVEASRRAGGHPMTPASRARARNPTPAHTTDPHGHGATPWLFWGASGSRDHHHPHSHPDHHHHAHPHSGHPDAGGHADAPSHPGFDTGPGSDAGGGGFDGGGCGGGDGGGGDGGGE